jgi:hypothetical protein
MPRPQMTADFHGRKIINLFGREGAVFFGKSGGQCRERLIIFRGVLPAAWMLCAGVG